MTPEYIIDYYSMIYKFCRISGYNPCIIGHNFWCDQNSIINCTDSVTIGNNVGIGAYSQLWTNFKFGDVMEGCKFNSAKPMIVGMMFGLLAIVLFPLLTLVIRAWLW